MEAYSSSGRVSRGGYCSGNGSAGPASSRNAVYVPNYSDDDVGFRSTLYIKVPEKTAPVPSGFYYVGGTVRTGFVISDDASDENKGVDYLCAGNQFVWVPVDDYSTFKTGTAEETFSGSGIYKMTGTLGSTSGSDAQYYSWSYGGSTTGANGTAINSSEYKEMQASVKKYGGFYIARFEAGDSSAESERTSSSEDGTLVSKKDVYPYTHVGWSDSLTTGSGASYALGTRLAVGFSKNMYKNHESVVSTLCYGVQWDATMNFVSDKGHNIVDSTSWGNYYTTTGTASLQKTGSNEAWKAKEIYDLAGNAGEWTLETVSGPGFAANGSSGAPVYRGGKCSSTSSLKSAARRYNGSFNQAYGEVAFRVALYLK